MSYSPILLKIWRLWRKWTLPLVRLRHKQESRKRVIGLQHIELDANRLCLVVRPVLPNNPLIISITSNEGQSLLQHSVGGHGEAIEPGVPLRLGLMMDGQLVDPDWKSYRLDIRQADYHYQQRLLLARRDGVASMGYTTVEGFLKTGSMMDVTVASLLPHLEAELQSLAHLGDEDFVQYCYLWLLGREADTGGYEQYLRSLATDMQRLELIVDMFSSKEAQNYRLFSSPSASGQAAYPFSAAHDRMRLAMGAIGQQK